MTLGDVLLGLVAALLFGFLLLGAFLGLLLMTVVAANVFMLLLAFLGFLMQ